MRISVASWATTAEDVERSLQAMLRAGGVKLRAEAATVRSREKIARKRARQAEPPAPPLKILDLLWWRRRFRLRSWILSQHLRERLPRKP
jgi:hypothetical protein